MKPNQIVISVLTQLCKVIPTWKIIPTQDIVDVAFRDPEVRKEVNFFTHDFLKLYDKNLNM